ncbi:HIRAN domain-containing protein [Virgibacillus sp. C22-A2]|uniref:HIRAN domain-containing protein n=1 Tax=Virgibacillus tibetensis TaxID=3042313 RepID=A0ABU6KGR1_9BACI|nr:HIRAN domain-containing protein [Virgibacillus sp. C22-A2]
MYFESSQADKDDFELFLYDYIGKTLKNGTVKRYGLAHTYILDEEKCSNFVEVMEKYNIVNYKILHEDEKNKKIRVYYVEPDFLIHEDRERFSNVFKELLCVGVRIITSNVYRGSNDEFDRKDKSYIILDKKYAEDARNIVKHVYDKSITANYVDVKSDQYEIDGLIWFELPELSNHPLGSLTKTDHVLDIFRLSEINYCVYNSSGGNITLNFWMERQDSRISQVSFRSDLKAVFKSSWEANFARVLNYLGAKWEYEKEPFLVKNDSITRVYHPDFFLEDNVIVELKGFWDIESIKRVELFKEQYNEYKLLILDADMYYTLDKLYRDVIPEWENNIVAVKKEKLPVVGVARPERKEFVNQIEIGDELLLKRDAENPYDKNAILVVDNGGNTIGFIGKDWASIYADKLDVGMQYKAIVTEKEAKVIKIDVKRNNLHEDILYHFLKLIKKEIS